MKTIKIAGVPEHFNLPWHFCIDDGEFEEAGIDLQWTDVPEGTGKMCQMLRDGETDVAVILTEGIVKDITAGNSCKIVQVYVKTPLIWGIHVASKYNQKLEDIQEWLSMTNWSQKQIDKKTLEKVQNQLHTLKIIEKIVPFEMIVK